VSPWWLRPPGEESDESEVAPQQREDKDRSRSGGEDVPSIADLVGGRSGGPAESEPNAEERTEPGVAPISVARERGAFFAPRRAPEESAQEQARAEAAAYASDLAEGRESTDSREASEPSEGAEVAEAADTSDTSENGEAAERPGRRRRRRGGRGRR
jgi:ribonuclease E